MTTSTSGDPLLRLLEQSMFAWRVLARVTRGDDGAIVVSGPARMISVRRAEPHLPFRWLVAIDGRTRPAVSIAAVMRQVRSALDPAFAGQRVRISAMPLSADRPG